MPHPGTHAHAAALAAADQSYDERVSEWQQDSLNSVTTAIRAVPDFMITAEFAAQVIATMSAKVARSFRPELAEQLDCMHDEL